MIFHSTKQQKMWVKNCFPWKIIFHRKSFFRKMIFTPTKHNPNLKRKIMFDFSASCIRVWNLPIPVSRKITGTKDVQLHYQQHINFLVISTFKLILFITSTLFSNTDLHSLLDCMKSSIVNSLWNET